MEKAKVYFTDMRTGYGGLSLPQKLAKLIKAAGIGNIDFNKKFAAIKIHFGEPGNVSYLRPNYAKAVADVVKVQPLFYRLPCNYCRWVKGYRRGLCSCSRW